MVDVTNRVKPGEVAQHWRSLAERRRQHLLALYHSGRWRKYYSEQQMMTQMRDLVRAINAWSEVGGEYRPPSQVQTPASTIGRPPPRPPSRPQ